MKRPTLSVTGLLLLLLAPLGRTQDQPRFRLPCAQILRMGLDRYVARYTAATHDDSTAGNIRACDAYAQCRRNTNDAQARALSPARRGQVSEVRRRLNGLAAACYEYTYLASGGGTMWSQMEAGDHAAREDFLAGLIAALRRPGRFSPATRRQADAALQMARRSLASLGSPQVEAPSAEDRSSLSLYRSRTYPAAQVAFARLQAVIASLPDAPARRVAREVRHELAAPGRNLSQVR